MVAAGLLALAGCTPKELDYQVHIITRTCDAALDPMAGVQFLRVYVRGDGISEPLDVVTAVNSEARQVTIPEIPSGKARVVEVRAFNGDPLSGGKVVSMGRSAPFDVPDVVPDDLVGKAIDVNVFLRLVNAFSPLVTAALPTQCQRMLTARAGHTATALKDGRVFIAGGFNLKPGSPQKQALADTEIYDPRTGAFQPARSISIRTGTLLPVAFQTATRLTSGQVLLWGGEVYADQSNAPSPKTQILVYDADVDEYGAFPNRDSPPSIARSRHRAAIDKNGKVLVVGGRTIGGAVAQELEWFDPMAPSGAQYKVVPDVALPRVEAAVAPVKQGEYIAVAGGTDGTQLVTDVLFFRYNGSTFVRETSSNPQLAQPGRRAPGFATIRDGADLLVMGGYSDLSDISPVASSQVITSQTGMVSQGPALTARGDICAVTMADGTVLAIGGRTAEMPGPTGDSSASTTLIRSSNQGGLTPTEGPNLPVPRYAHTCTALDDGTVLVTGGINETVSGGQEILQDAWIYQPAPVD